jgi:competence protein ComEC
MNFDPQTVFRKQPMAYIAVAFIVGILLNRFLDASSMIPIIVILVLVSFIIIRKWNFSFLLIVLLMIVLGFLITSYKNDSFNKSLDEIKNLSEKPIEFTGIVADEVHYSSGQRFVLSNIRFLCKDITYESDAKYIVYPKKEKIEGVFSGDTLRGTGKWQLFNDIRNPGEYDFKKYYHNKKIAGKIYSQGEIQILSNKNWSLNKTISGFRENIRSKLTAYSDNETSALLSALILGDRTRIDQDLRESFANVGVIHVLAVSGLHVGYVLIILLLIVKFIRIPWGWDKIFIVLGLILFTLLSGGRPSVIRASIMAGIYIYAPVINRRPNAWNIIATAAFLILLASPNSLYDLGFQLSFSAVISIVYFYNLFNRILPEILKVSNIKNNVIRFFWALLLVSFSAQLGTIPVIAYYFGRIPLIAIFANLIIIPLIGGFVALGFTKLFLFWISPLSYFIDQVNWLIKESIYLSVSIFDKFPYASISTPQFNWINLIQYILIVGLFFLIIKRNYSKVIIFSVLLLNSFLWPWVFEKKDLDIIFLDLGSNESTIIKSDDKSLLINAGVISMFANDLNRKILPAVKHLNIKNFNHMINSHGNSNNQISIAKSVETIPIDTIWSIGLNSDSWIDEYTRNMIELKNIDFNIINPGEVIRIDGQSDIQFILPLVNNQTKTSPLAMKIVNGSNSILFIDKLTDSDFEVLINDREVIKSDVLKMSYPKRMPQNINKFLNIVDASKIIITGAKTSKFAPTYTELDDIIDSELHFTDLDGAVWLYSNGKSQFEVKEWK